MPGLALILGLAAQACADDDSESATQASGACTPGLEGCPCGQGGACAVGLECVSNACVDPSMFDSTTTGGGEDPSTSSGGGSASASAGSSATTDDPTGDSGSDGACGDNADCASDEVCYLDACFLIDDLYFNVTVHMFEPSSCDDGWGEAELYYDFYEAGEYVESSSISDCPGSWLDEPLFYDPLFAFELAFWESDAFSDDYITGLCWGNTECESVPDSILRAGWWDGYDSDIANYYALSFTPTLY
ncbi:MAG: hypothetical protein R3A79_16565 [Nannocystaceae bacterium]